MDGTGLTDVKCVASFAESRPGDIVCAEITRSVGRGAAAHHVGSRIDQLAHERGKKVSEICF